MEDGEILTAGFVAADRQPLHSGRLDENVREKFVEYYAFLRRQTAGAKKKKRKSRS